MAHVWLSDDSGWLSSDQVTQDLCFIFTGPNEFHIDLNIKNASILQGGAKYAQLMHTCTYMAKPTSSPMQNPSIVRNLAIKHFFLNITP